MKWKDVQLNKTYIPTEFGSSQPVAPVRFNAFQHVVDQIILPPSAQPPAQLAYTFDYNTTSGWAR